MWCTTKWFHYEDLSWAVVSVLLIRILPDAPPMKADLDDARLSRALTSLLSTPSVPGRSPPAPEDPSAMGAAKGKTCSSIVSILRASSLHWRTRLTHTTRRENTRRRENQHTRRVNTMNTTPACGLHDGHCIHASTRLTSPHPAFLLKCVCSHWHSWRGAIGAGFVSHCTTKQQTTKTSRHSSEMVSVSSAY